MAIEPWQRFGSSIAVEPRYVEQLASHGRPDRAHNQLGHPWLGTSRLYLRRLHLDNGGYDEGGTYWGHGEPLYWATDGAGVDVFRRASNRVTAKRIILEQFSTARFFR